MHYEVELALIMGKTVRDLKESNTQGALDAIDSKSLPNSGCIRTKHNQATQLALT